MHGHKNSTDDILSFLPSNWTVQFADEEAFLKILRSTAGKKAPDILKKIKSTLQKYVHSKPTNTNIIQSMLDEWQQTLTSQIFHEVVRLCRSYINSSDVNFPQKYHSQSYFHDSVRYVTPGDQLDSLNKCLDKTIPQHSFSKKISSMLSSITQTLIANPYKITSIFILSALRMTSSMPTHDRKICAANLSPIFYSWQRLCPAVSFTGSYMSMPPKMLAQIYQDYLVDSNYPLNDIRIFIIGYTHRENGLDKMNVFESMNVKHITQISKARTSVDPANLQPLQIKGRKLMVNTAERVLEEGRAWKKDLRPCAQDLVDSRKNKDEWGYSTMVCDGMEDKIALNNAGKWQEEEKRINDEHKKLSEIVKKIKAENPNAKEVPNEIDARMNRLHQDQEKQLKVYDTVFFIDRTRGMINSVKNTLKEPGTRVYFPIGSDHIFGKGMRSYSNKTVKPLREFFNREETKGNPVAYLYPKADQFGKKFRKKFR